MAQSKRAEDPDRSSCDEADLLRRVHAFDEAALSRVYRAYRAPIYRYMYHHLGDAQTAQDLTGDVFRRFLQALRKGSGPRRRLRAWLYRVAHNLIVDELRRRTHRNHQPLDEVPGEMLVESDQGLEEAAGRAIAGARVRVALRQLMPEQRQVIVLKFLEGMDNAEIAALMGKTVGAVKALQYRGLVALREEFTREQFAREQFACEQSAREQGLAPTAATAPGGTPT